MTVTTVEPATQERQPAERMRATMCATRVSFIWFGTRKTLTSEQKAQAAESFGAQGEFLSAGKKLLDTKHARFKAVSSVRNRARSYWASISLPFPEPGIRLVRQTSLESFHEQMTEFKEELDDAVEQLDEQYTSWKSAARERLGSLYNEADYPVTLAGLFDVG